MEGQVLEFFIKGILMVPFYEDEGLWILLFDFLFQLMFAHKS